MRQAPALFFFVIFCCCKAADLVQCIRKDYGRIKGEMGLKEGITFKRALALLLLIALLCTSVQFSAFAESDGNTPAVINNEFENTHVNTGNHRIDIVSIAKTQVGYMEGDDNDTKYGTWYGLPNQPWCGMFVSWCARQAGVPTDILRN